MKTFQDIIIHCNIAPPNVGVSKKFNPFFRLERFGNDNDE
jgi:hypothetical protein